MDPASPPLKIFKTVLTLFICVFNQVVYAERLPISYLSFKAESCDMLSPPTLEIQNQSYAIRFYYEEVITMITAYLYNILIGN